MAIHGRALDRIITEFRIRRAFPQKGNAMSAIAGATLNQGRMPTEEWTEYRAYADARKIAYTVISYGTPIAYVLIDNTKIVPDVSYSRTTTGHQTLCRVYL